MSRKAQFQSASLTTIRQCAAALSSQPTYIAAPLQKHLTQVEQAIGQGSPDAARRLRRLLDAIDYVDEMLGRRDNQALQRTRDFSRSLLAIRVMN